MIIGIKQIHIQVSDIDRAIDFYQNILGLTLTMALTEQNMAFFDCNGVRLYLGNNPEYHSNPFIYYQTDSIEEDCQQLASQGVEFIKQPMLIHQTEQHESWLAAFKDSEGNTLHLMQDKSLG